MARLEIFGSFRSPYTYLAIDRLVAISVEFDLDVAFRPVRPLAMREPDFFERGRKQFLPYLFQDVPREAARLGIPVGAPNPDPIVMDLASGVVAAEQPIMDKIIALSVAACHVNQGLIFAQAVMRSIWGGASNWNQPAVLKSTLDNAGISLTALQDWADRHRELTAAEIAQNEADQLVHHWGGPLMTLDGEPFFGQDRTDALIWRLDQMGLRRS